MKFDKWAHYRSKLQPEEIHRKTCTSCGIEKDYVPSAPRESPVMGFVGRICYECCKAKRKLVRDGIGPKAVDSWHKREQEAYAKMTKEERQTYIAEWMARTKLPTY